MDPSSSSTVTKAQRDTVRVLVEQAASVDARIVDKSHGHTYNADNGGRIEIHTGAHITINSQNFPPDEDKEEIPPLPRCPAPCTGYIRRKALEDHMSSYFFQDPSNGGHRRKCYVLHGLGGSGKTQSALNFMDENFHSLEPEQRRFSEAYWVDATTVDTITKSLEDIALSAGLSKVEDALALLASHNSRSNWIMLYNNADDPSLNLTKYFPKCTHGNIIITTRNHQAARYGLGPGSDYPVSGMAYDEAKELFINQARLFDTSPATIQVVDQLLEELGHFPLSVRQSGAYIFATSCTPAEYFDKFQTRRKQLLRKHNELNAEDYQHGTVQATISLSFARLSLEAQRLLQLFAWLHREYILVKLFRDGFSGLCRYKRYYRRLATKDEKETIASLNQFRNNLISGGCWDIDKFRGLLTELKSFSLATSIPEQQTLSVHLLVQGWTRSAMDKTTQRVVWRSTVLLLGSAIGKNSAKTNEELSFLRALAPHVDEMMKEGREIFDGCSNELGSVYKQVGRWGDEKNLREGYNKRCQKILGQQNVKSLTSKSKLAETYRSQGNYEKAAEMESEVLEIRKVKLGLDHPSTLISMNNLALTYRAQGNYEKAAEMNSEVFDIRKVKLGVDHPDTLTSMSNLASTYSDQGNYDKAAEMQTEVLELRKLKLGVDHPDTLASMNNLALTYSYQGNYEKAAEMQSEDLEICKTKLGADHPDTLTSMNNLALTYNSQGNYDKAAEMQIEVFKIWKLKLGIDHPSTLCSMNNLALTYRSQGDYSKAAEMQTEVLEICKVKLGADHPSTLASMNNLALTYSSQGNYIKAAEMESEVLEICKVKLGVDHPSTLTSMSNLALTYSSQGNYSKTAEMQSEVFETWKVKLGADHPNTLIAMSNLASTYSSQGNYLKAAEMKSEILDIRKVKLGFDHPDTLTSMSNLASTYSDQGNYEKAAEIQSEVLDIRKVKLGFDHPSTLISMSNLALTYCDQSKYSKAAEMYSEVLNIRMVKLGVDHPSTLTSMENLALTYLDMKDLNKAAELFLQLIELQTARFGADHSDTQESVRNLYLVLEQQHHSNTHILKPPIPTVGCQCILI